LEQQNNYEAGIDLADVFIRELKKVEIDYSDSELTINEIEQHTPEIWELIKAFDLVDNRNYEIRKVIK
jgi:hypothetical protein